MVAERRQYRRFKANGGRLVGRLNRTSFADVIDIGVGGAALRIDRRLKIGKEYMVRFEDRRNSIDVPSVVVRSQLIDSVKTFHGERALVYASAVRFIEGMEDRIADFICDSILV